MKFDEIDDVVIEELKQLQEKAKPVWYKTKKFFVGLFGTILTTIYQNQEQILDYLKGIDFKWYLLAACIVSVLTYMGLKKGEDK